MAELTRRGVMVAGGSALAAGCRAAPGPSLPQAVSSGHRGDRHWIEEALGNLAGFADLRAGGSGDIACGEWLEAVLMSEGFETRRQSFPTPWFEPSLAFVRSGNAEAEVWPQGIVVPTGPAGVTGPLRIWRRAGDVPDPAGAIVLMVLPHARHSQLASPVLSAAIRPLSEAGAAAVILVTSGPSGDRIVLNAAPGGPAWPQPMAVIGPEDAEAFYALAGVEATLVTDGRGGHRPAFNLIGTVRQGGPGVVISTPRSGWGPCMGERGPGIAVFYALARTLRQALPGHDLTFLVTSGHEYDNLGSHHALADAVPAPSETRLWFHLGAGFAARDWHETARGLLPLRSADPQRFLVASEAFLPVLEEEFAGLPGLEVPYPARMGGAGELAEIQNAGYTNAAGMFGAHRFHHSANDTADKTGAELILPVLRAVRSSLIRLA